MSILKNTVVLDNQMSAALEQIKKDALAVMESMGKLPEISNEIADYMGLMTEKSAEFKKSFGMTLEEMHEKSEKMLEVFGETKESIAEMTEKVHEKAEAIDEVAESIGNVGKNSNEAMRGMGNMANGVARLLGQLGLIPRSFAMGVSGVSQLERGIRRSTTSAGKLVAMLGPITLVATAVMAIVNTISMLRSSSDDALDSVEHLKFGLDDLARSKERLANEAERFERELYAATKQLERMISVGASDDLVLHLERQNDILRERIDLYGVLTGMDMVRTLEEARRQFRNESWGETDNYVDYLFRRLEQNRIRTMRGEIFEGDRTIEALVADYIKKADILGASANEADRAMAEMINSALAMFSETHSEFAILSNYVSGYAAEMERLSIEYERLAAVEAARAVVVQNVHSHILRSYRDTYAAAESMRSAHNALTHAINGTSSAYNSHLHYFNQIMSLSPQYFNMLFDERGALLDVEDAVHAVTQAQIELMGARQANAILDSVQAWIDETGSLLGYRAAVLDATDGVWGLVEARKAEMLVAEQNRIIADSMGTIPAQYALLTAQGRMGGVVGQIDAIRQMTESAQASARRYGTTRTNPLYVADVTAHDIMGEFVRLREDVARREYMTGAFQRGRVVNVYMGGYSYTHSPNVYPAELSAGYRADIVREGAQTGAMMASEMLEEAISGSLE